MKYFKNLYTIIVLLLVMNGGLGYVAYTARGQGAELASLKDKDKEAQDLGQYAINAMFDSRDGSKLSDARKQNLARSIVKVANDVFENRDQKEHFVMVIMMESGFQKYAQSPTGPKGLTQVAKASFKEGLTEYCGVKGVSDEDVWDTDLNLYAGACYFRRQIDEVKGNLPRAALRYNQGPASAADKSYAKGGRVGSVEGLEYIARITYLEKTLTSEKSPNKPGYQPNLNVSKVDSSPNPLLGLWVKIKTFIVGLAT